MRKMSAFHFVDMYNQERIRASIPTDESLRNVRLGIILI